MHILGLDHLVLTIRDLERTRAFYVQALGMTYQAFGNQKLNPHPPLHPMRT